MTPIILPLSEKSDVPNHWETRYLLRSILKFVPDPWLIIVGHRPDWLAVDHGQSRHIQDVGRVTHLPASDDLSKNPDYNMGAKILKGCNLLVAHGHTTGFIRVSDDNLFLSPYQKRIYVGDTIKNFITKMDNLKQVARQAQNGSLMGLENKYVNRMRRFLSAMNEAYGEHDIRNFDAHVATWYFSPESFIDMWNIYEDLFANDKATINSAYYNCPLVTLELEKQKELLEYWLPRQRGESPAIGWIDRPIDAEFILAFTRDIRAPKWPLLGYAAQAVKGTKGHHFIGAVEAVFNQGNEFERE